MHRIGHKGKAHVPRWTLDASSMIRRSLTVVSGKSSMGFFIILGFNAGVFWSASAEKSLIALILGEEAREGWSESKATKFII